MDGGGCRDRFMLTGEDVRLTAQRLRSAAAPWRSPGAGREAYDGRARARRRTLGILAGSPPPIKVDQENRDRPAVAYRRSRLSAIQQTPVAILDTPDLRDDFYLNILDWSLQNVVSVALDCAVYSYNYQSKETKCVTFSGNDNYVSSLRSLKMGSLLAVANAAGCFSIVDVESEKEVTTGAIPTEGRIAVMASKDNCGMFSDNTILTGSHGGDIYAYDLRSKARAPSMVFRGHDMEVCGLQMAPDSWLFASGGNDNRVCIWDLRKAQPLHEQGDYKAAVKALSWCPWQRNLLAIGSGTGDKRIRFCNAAVNSCLRTIYTDSQVCSAIWSPITSELITSHGYVTNELSIWQYPTLSKVVSIPAHETRILHSAISPDGTTVATTAANESLKFWELYKRHPILRNPVRRKGGDHLSRLRGLTSNGDLPFP